MARRRRRQVSAVVGLVVIATASGAVLERRLGQPTVATTPSSVVAQPSTGYNTLWAKDAHPISTRPAHDWRSVEVGVRFGVSRSGDIIGLRFYRGSRETAPHRGSLWDARGKLLGSLTFAGSSQSGWQYAHFDRPVQLAAGQIYVASYHSRSGYVVQQNYFGRTAVTRDALTVLPDLPGSPNGVFVYARGSAFPANTFRSSNYWVDVLFRPTDGTTVPVPTSVPTTPPVPTVGPISPTPSPTPPPSATSTAPAPTSGPTAPPPAGGVPAPGSVGFRGDPASLKVIDSSGAAPAGTAWQGSYLRVNADNVTMDGVYVKGGVDYYGHGTLTIHNSIVEGNGGIWSPILGRSGHLDIRDTTVRWRPGAPPPGSGWGNGAIHGDATMTVIRCDISGTPDGIQIGPGNSLFEQNYIHDLARIGTVPNNTHNDGIQSYGGPGLVIRYNRIDLDGYDGTHQNAALFFQPDSSNPAVSPQIIGNYLEGGGYVLRLEAPLSGAVVQDNTFGPLNGGFGYAYARDGATVAVWSGNHTTDGKVVAKP
jgi:hypothetical protein